MDDPSAGERNRLVDVGSRTEEVADFVKGAAEAMSRIEIPEAAHRPVAPLYSPVMLFDYVVFILTGTMVDVRAEFVGDDPGITGMAVGGDLLRFDLGDRSGAMEERPGGSHVAGPAQVDVDQVAIAVDCPVEIAPLPGNFEVGLILSTNSRGVLQQERVYP